MKKDKKLYEAQRNVTSLEVIDWDSLIDRNHLARRTLNVLDQLNLSTLYAKVNSHQNHQGRPAVDPKIMLALWVYAYMQGISSSRALAEHCKWEPGLRWILGYDLSIKHVVLSEFRKQLGKDLDDILTQVVSIMIVAQVVDLDEVILDGTKIKANAGRSSFRTKEELQALQSEVKEKINNLNSDQNKQKHRDALQKKQERIEEGLAQIPGIEQACIEAVKHKKKDTKVKEAKASSTDPDARKMRFPDGSSGPGYNPQIMTTSSGFIVDVKATQDRNDTNQLSPMIDSFKSRYGKLPKRVLADSQYAVIEDVEEALENKIDIYCPSKKGRKNSTVASQKRLERKRAKEPQIIKDWRTKMETGEAKIVRRRRSRIEKVHGWIKSNMTHCQLNLRGLVGAQTEMLLFAIGYNLKRYVNITPLRLA